MQFDKLYHSSKTYTSTFTDQNVQVNVGMVRKMGCSLSILTLFVHGKFNHRSLVWALIRSEKQQVRFSRGWLQLTFVAKTATKVDLQLILGNKDRFPSCDVSLTKLPLSYSRRSLTCYLSPLRLAVITL